MIRILHVASFIGNVGDNASHQGFYSLLDTLLGPCRYLVEKLEMRRFYKKYQGEDKQYFNQDFVDYANTFDLLVIGGGGFLDYWVEDSVTGTTIDIEIFLIEKIRVATLITSVGCIPHHQVPAGNIKKFSLFLKAILSNSNIKIAVRNDGSLLSLREDVGSGFDKAIPEVVDHAFFYDKATFDMTQAFPKPYVAINITADQLLMQSKSRGDIFYDLYYKELAVVIEYLSTVEKYHIILVPHISSDLKAISILFGYLKDFIVRKSVSVAPCIQGDKGANIIFGIYQESAFVIATRFHANVCNLARGVPTLGLGALDRVKYLYDQMGVSDYYIDIQGNFSDHLLGKIHKNLVSNVEDYVVNKKNMTVNIYSEFLTCKGLI